VIAGSALRRPVTCDEPPRGLVAVRRKMATGSHPIPAPLRRGGVSTTADKLGRMADEDLMALVAATDADAFSVLYDRHITAAYSLAYRIAGSQSLADDVTQAAFLSVWRSAGRYDSRQGSVRSWVLSITHNRAIDQLRRATRHTDRQAAGDVEAAERLPAREDTEAAAIEAVQGESTRALLDTLPDRQRRVVELSFYSGYSHAEIAALLEVPLGTIKGRMRRALDRLRDELVAIP